MIGSLDPKLKKVSFRRHKLFRRKELVGASVEECADRMNVD